MNISFDNTTEYILTSLENAGFSAYIVGGSLRDLLLGMEVHDTDIATNALPAQVEEVFKGMNVIETGLKHGTVTLVIDHIPYEITTFRTEGPYSDSRRPDAVYFTDTVEEDLKRRDFTINALAYSKSRGLVDLFGGEEDLKNKVLKAVGDPGKRFSEDALRIMRGLRFAAVLGFDIEDKTKAAIFEYLYLLEKIAAERIYTELIRMLGGKGFDSVLRTFFPVFQFILPEAVLPEKDLTILPEPLFRLATLFQTEADAKAALRRLKADNNTVTKVTMLIGSDPVPANTAEIKYFLCKYNSNALDIALFRELYYSEKGAYERVKKVYESGECYSLAQLAVNGYDIEKLGYSGRETGVVLGKLLDMVIRGTVKNTKEALLNAVKNIDNRRLI
jgi:tRNA nucleotidyltransferase (CCA-adding enzyme)